MVGRLEEAAAYLRQALAANPRHVDSLNTFGAVLTKQGRMEEASEAFRRVVALDPGNATAAHMIAAISGDTTATAPRDYVRKLFDTFAWRFDHLQELTGKHADQIITERQHMVAAQ